MDLLAIVVTDVFQLPDVSCHGKMFADGDKTDGEESGQLTPPPKSVSNDNEIGAIFILI